MYSFTVCLFNFYFLIMLFIGLGGLESNLGKVGGVVVPDEHAIGIAQVYNRCHGLSDRL